MVVIGKFLRELKRRRVLNTAFLYVVGAWVALQVVEVLAGAGFILIGSWTLYKGLLTA